MGVDGPSSLAWVLVACAFLVALLAALLLPWKIRVSAQGQALPDGGWAFAYGAAWHFLAITGLLAARVPATLQVRLLGRKIWSPALPGRGATAEARWPERLRRLIDASMAESSHELPADTLRLWSFCWQERRRVAVPRLHVRARYCFADVALTGRMLGALHLLTAMLPPQIVVDQEPVWDFEDHLVLQVDGCIKVWVGRAVLDVVRYLMTNSRLFKNRAAPGAAPT